ncbi:MAG: hypothetical protein WCI75_10155 [candidate division NC10 bacterium]
MRIQQVIPIAPGQRFTIERFRPEDAPGIASLFLSVYGPTYPVEAYYDPEQIIALHTAGRLHSVVARTPTGDIVGHGALYRSSPPHPRLYEGGLLIVPPAYRGSLAAYKINVFMMETLPPLIPLDSAFGEVVCNHTIAQRSSLHFKACETGLEVDVLPRAAEADPHEPGGRVSCLFMFRNYRDAVRRTFIPPAYAQQIAFVLDGAGLERECLPSATSAPADSTSDVAVACFPGAGVSRFTVARPGADFATRVSEIEIAAEARAIPVRQFFLGVDVPWIGHAVDILRERGYFFGGYLPRWFDSDGLLLQKVTLPPNFDGIQLHSEKAKRLLECIRADWARTR